MDTENEKNNLEDIAQSYIEADPGRMVDQKLLAMISGRLQAWLHGDKILEMGFGDDVWTRHILKKCGHSYIVDASQALLDQATARYGDQVTPFQSLFEEFDPPYQMDTVIASFILEHVEDPVAVLQRIQGWTNPGGRIIVILPNANSFHRRLAVCMGLQSSVEDMGSTDDQLGHRRVYTAEAAETDIRAAGLEIVEKEGLFAKFVPQSLMVGFSDEVLKGLMCLGEELPMQDCATLAFLCQSNNSEH